MNAKSKFVSMSAWRELGFDNVEDRVYRDKDGKYYIEPLMAPGIGSGALILVGKKKPVLNGNTWIFEDKLVLQEEKIGAKS